jgi:hypothetical protein
MTHHFYRLDFNGFQPFPGKWVVYDMVFTTLPNMSKDHELPGIFAKASFCKGQF